MTFANVAGSGDHGKVINDSSFDIAVVESSPFI